MNLIIVGMRALAAGRYWSMP